MTLANDAVVVVSKTQLSAPMRDETIIAGLESGHYYGVRGVAERIWQLVQSPIAARDVLHAIVSEYDVAEEQCRADVFALLEQLADEGLIEVERAHAS